MHGFHNPWVYQDFPPSILKFRGHERVKFQKLATMVLRNLPEGSRRALEYPIKKILNELMDYKISVLGVIWSQIWKRYDCVVCMCVV